MGYQQGTQTQAAPEQPEQQSAEPYPQGAASQGLQGEEGADAEIRPEEVGLGAEQQLDAFPEVGGCGAGEGTCSRCSLCQSKGVRPREAGRAVGCAEALGFFL